MAVNRRKNAPRPVVSIAPNGEINGYFESILQAANIYGTNMQAIWKALNYGTYCRKMHWMYEEDYKRYWMEGRTSELAYNRKKERSENIRKGMANMSPEAKARLNKAKSENRKRWLKEHPEKSFEVCVKRKFRRCRCLTTGEEFESIKECAEKHGLVLDSLRRAFTLRGGRHKGKVYQRL